MNAALRLLYRGGAWLPAADATQIGTLGLRHVRAYKRCAELSVSMRQPRFPIHSKDHMIDHQFRFLIKWSRGCDFVENPLVDSCQLDESFVGVVARSSRRVSPASTISRTLDMYLTALQQHLQQHHELDSSNGA